LDNNLTIHGLRVVSGNNGFFVSMPSKRKEDGNYQNIVHPTNSATKAMIENAVLDAYDQEINS
jgi:stage V sporulation protein G